MMRYHWGLGIGHTYSHAFRPETLEAYPTTCDNTDSSSHVPVISICDLPTIGVLLLTEPELQAVLVLCCLVTGMKTLMKAVQRTWILILILSRTLTV
jgi:hypothetical protein